MISCEEDAIEVIADVPCGTVVPSCQYRASPLSRVFQMDTTPASSSPVSNLKGSAGVNSTPGSFKRALKEV